MTQNEIIRQTEENVLHTYNRFPIAIDRGEGVRVWDADGKEYLDFMAGIAVFALGYHFPGYDEALIAQIRKTLHTSNLYYHEPLAEASKKLVRSSGLSRAFFTNSGAEAIEGAVKAAKKYAWLKDGRGDHEIIAMNSSFHGRTVGALSVTGNAHYQEPFLPLMAGVKFAEFNDFDSVLSCVSERTCAVILETVQGEGGIYPAEAEFLKKVRALCDEKDLVLILDEIQCGMGRTGKMWAYEHYGIVPDILTCAKALGCGVPVGAFLLGEKAAAAFIRVFNRKLFEQPEDQDHMLSWSLWYFPVINTVESLREIDRYAQDCLRFLISGRRTKARYNVRYDDLKQLGYRSLVHEYYSPKP